MRAKNSITPGGTNAQISKTATGLVSQKCMVRNPHCFNLEPQSCQAPRYLAESFPEAFWIGPFKGPAFLRLFPLYVLTVKICVFVLGNVPPRDQFGGIIQLELRIV